MKVDADRLAEGPDSAEAEAEIELHQRNCNLSLSTSRFACFHPSSPHFSSFKTVIDANGELPLTF